MKVETTGSEQSELHEKLRVKPLGVTAEQLEEALEERVNGERRSSSEDRPSSIPERRQTQRRQPN